MKRHITTRHLLLLLLITCVSCYTTQAQEKQAEAEEEEVNFVVEGKAENVKAGTEVFLQRIDLGKMLNIVATAPVKEDGTFRLEGNIPEKAICNLRYPLYRGSMVLIIENDSELEVSFDSKDPKAFTVSGNQESEQIKSFVDSIMARSYGKEAIMNYADTVDNAYVGYVVTNSMKMNPTNFHLFDKQVKRMVTQAPENTLTKRYAGFVSKNKGMIATKIGVVAPNIAEKNPQGDTITLESYRGKYVLVDFWASWCKPCRRDNPNLVRAYNQYKDKGLEIYSVSMDKVASKWEAAIEQDGLVWEGNVSDLGGWLSKPAKDWNVKSIPSNFLIDPEGKIIAKKLRGALLDQKLEKIFGKAGAEIEVEEKTEIPKKEAH